MSESLVVVGGVGAIEPNLERVAEDCRDFYNADNVDVFAFDKATASQAAQLGRAVASASEIVTHSGGMLAVSQVWEKPRQDQRLLACSPPIPSTRARLMAQSVCKIPATHLRHIAFGAEDERWANLRTLRAFLAGSSLKSLGKGRLKATAAYDAFAVSESIKQEFGTAIGLVYATQDEFFRPEESRIDQARRAGVYATASFEGHHNDFVVNPTRVLGSEVVDIFLNQ